MKQELPHDLHVGDAVRVRNEDWHVTETSPGDRCLAVTLVGASATNRGCRRVLLAPFDRLRPLPARRLARRVTWATWLHAARVLVTATTPAECLRAAAAARILLLPHQLEPALAASRGLASRFLLADGVGLGKTIQAGLLLAELRLRGLAARSLVLTPPGLCDQWVGELRARFNLDATIVDRSFVRHASNRFALDVNPWQLPDVVVASLDYAKRPDVAPALAELTWDVLIVDEAHAVAPGSDRAAFVDSLALQARHVVLLTATPHAGDPAAFAHLCGIGALDDEPVLLFRRTRLDVGVPAGRRTTLLPVTPTAAERRMHRLLAAYTRIVWAGAPTARRPDALLVLAVLNKRALSSARSLACSVARRAALLEGEADRDDGSTQLALDFDEGETDPADAAPRALGRPALVNLARERRYLHTVHRAAVKAAAAGESKIAALQRLLRRTAEPVLVFTEYRDTLAWLAERLRPEAAAMLHGGMTRRERLAAVDRFCAGQVRVLLATDAAGEGLNLQARCRLVLNLELPWTPRRLEQRTGRVDRIGQTRTVHAIHLLARDTGEADVLARLVQRRARIRAALGDTAGPEPFPSESDLVAAFSGGRPFAVENGSERSGASQMPSSRPAQALPDAGLTRRIDLHADAVREVLRVRTQRRIRDGAAPAARLSDAGTVRDRAALDRRWPWFAAAPAGRFSILPGPGLLLLCRYRVVTTAGSLVEENVLPIWLSCDLKGIRPAPRALGALVGRALQIYDRVIRPVTDDPVGRRLDALRAAQSAALARAARRDQAIAAHAEARVALATHLLQQGLFDRRAVRTAERQLARQARDRATRALREAARDAAGQLRLAGPPEPMLVLLSMPRRR